MKVPRARFFNSSVLAGSLILACIRSSLDSQIAPDKRSVTGLDIQVIGAWRQFAYYESAKLHYYFLCRIRINAHSLIMRLTWGCMVESFSDATRQRSYTKQSLLTFSKDVLSRRRLGSWYWQSGRRFRWDSVVIVVSLFLRGRHSSLHSLTASWLTQKCACHGVSILWSRLLNIDDIPGNGDYGRRGLLNWYVSPHM